MSAFVVIRGKRKKLGIIFRLTSREGGSFIVKRVISKLGRDLAVEYEVEGKVGDTFRLLVIKNTKPEAIAFVRNANKAIKLAKKSGRIAKKAGLITGAALVKVGKFGFRFLEKATRPTKRAKSKKKKQRRRKQKRRKQKRR